MENSHGIGVVSLLIHPIVSDPTLHHTNHHPTAHIQPLPPSLHPGTNYEARCAKTCVSPLRCQSASGMLQLPHLCSTSLNQFVRYGTQPKQKQQQHSTAARLFHHLLISSIPHLLDLDESNKGKGEDLLRATPVHKRRAGHLSIATCGAIDYCGSLLQ